MGMMLHDVPRRLAEHVIDGTRRRSNRFDHEFGTVGGIGFKPFINAQSLSVCLGLVPFHKSELDPTEITTAASPPLKMISLILARSSGSSAAP